MLTSVISRGWRRLVIAAIGVALLFALVPSTAFAQLPTPTYGWNIGNTMEPPSGEGTWNNPPVTQQLINAVAAAGFNTVRIPCAWDSHATNMVIDPAWLARVKEVVDYCYANNLYVILNSHWDNGWLDNTIKRRVDSTVNAKVNAYWTQIANTFIGYNDRLIFACTNEPDVDNAAEMSVLSVYYQTFVGAVRATGGNNTSRWLVIQGPCTNIDLTDELLNTLPNDPTPGRLMVEVHYYDPYNFTMMTADEWWGNQFYFWGQGYHSTTMPEHNPTWGEEDWLTEQFQKMKVKFVDQGIPVILGEFGAIKRTENPELTGADFNLHVAARTYFYKSIVDTANSKGLKPVYWDNGWAGADGWALFDRYTNAVIDPDAATALTGGPALPPPGGGGKMHVDSITCSKVRAGNKWKGSAVVVIKDASGVVVPSATVTGTFSGSYNQTLSGTTGSNGSVTLTTTSSVSGTVTFQFCVTNVTHATLTYDSGANVETCDSFSG